MPNRRNSYIAVLFLLVFMGPWARMWAQDLRVQALPVGYLLEWSGLSDPEGCQYVISLARGQTEWERARLRAGEGRQDRYQFLLPELIEEETTLILRVFTSEQVFLREQRKGLAGTHTRGLRILEIMSGEGDRPLRLELESRTDQPMTWLVQDLQRRTVREGHRDLVSGPQTLTLDLGSLPAGGYHLFLQAGTDQHNLTLRISDRGTMALSPGESE
jgi:hypothetical protein